MANERLDAIGLLNTCVRQLDVIQAMFPYTSTIKPIETDGVKIEFTPPVVDIDSRNMGELNLRIGGEMILKKGVNNGLGQTFNPITGYEGCMDDLFKLSGILDGIIRRGVNSPNYTNEDKRFTILESLTREYKKELARSAVIHGYELELPDAKIKMQAGSIEISLKQMGVLPALLNFGTAYSYATKKFDRPTLSIYDTSEESLDFWEDVLRYCIREIKHIPKTEYDRYRNALKLYRDDK